MHSSVTAHVCFLADRYVLVGSARDSWGQSELGGTAVLLELTAVFGQLLKEGERNPTSTSAVK